MKRNTILAGISIFRMILLLFAIVIFGEGNALAQGAVWLYKPGETEPYGTYSTVKDAVSALNNTVKKDNCIIELHGEVEETVSNLQPTYSVTFRSEKNADHTLKFKLSKSTYSGFYLSTASKTMSFGCGSDYGILTIDMNNCGNAISLRYGTLDINDGIAFINGCFEGSGGAIIATTANAPVLNINGGVFRNNEASNGYGGAICVTSKAKINVNGGLFENNSAANGGAIAVVPHVATSGTTNGSMMNLNGGTFIGNTSNTTSPEGNAIYYSATGPFTIGGTLQFGADQDIYLASDANDPQKDRVLVKNSEINISGSNPIPVLLANVIEYRNVLTSGDVTVVAADLNKFSIVDDTDYLKSMYLGLSFAEIDKINDKPSGSINSPVLELRTHFEANMGNFINSDFDHFFEKD